jgi:phenylalanyl-tRNA synthetase beta chain
MKLSDHWLREWVNPDLNPAELGHVLTMAGLELDSLESAAPAYSGVVVGHIAAIEQHPDADKLRICQVEYGQNESIQVVCGASNAAEGMKVPFATVGANLPGGLKIKKAKLRGVESFGMLCSAKEIGLADSAEGLLVLPEDAPVGEDFRNWLDLDDQVYDIDLTPNRADCLSVAGIARETALLTSASLETVLVAPVLPGCDDVVSVRVEDVGSCPRYAGRVIRGVNAAAETPLWMQERLRRSGIRSINAIVDITNYVMIELGQPMHAFDMARLSGDIVVRQAGEKEKLTLLDGQEIETQPGTLLICDEARPLALAGIMGGEHSGVTADSQNIFLESAFFTPEAIAGRARQYGLHTDSSHRFERGVDPLLQADAIERASTLILELCGGELGPLSDVQSESGAYVPEAIHFRYAQIERVLGVTIDSDEVEGILERLGCQHQANDGGWTVIPPSFRFDLRIEVDLIEEVARVYGYHRIEGKTQSFNRPIEVIPEDQLPADDLKEVLVNLGYWEAVTFTFVDPEIEKILSPNLKPVALANPISSEMAVMRTTLWAGMIKAVQYNLNRQQSRVRLFETGLSFVPSAEGLVQRSKLAGIVTGSVLPESWGYQEREVDFHDVKGDVEAILDSSVGISNINFQVLDDHPALHPGQSASIYLDGNEIGVMGALHPEVEKKLGLDQRLYCFELDLDSILHRSVPKFSESSKFPAIRRDLAIMVEEQISAAQIQESIRGLGIKTIQDFYIFDVYTGEGVPSGLKSIALGLILQDLSRTLNDQEVDELVHQVVTSLEKDVGASLRK